MYRTSRDGDENRSRSTRGLIDGPTGKGIRDLSYLGATTDLGAAFFTAGKECRYAQIARMSSSSRFRSAGTGIGGITIRSSF